MKTAKINSKKVREIRWIAESKRMYIVYNNAKEYAYLGISERDYLKLVNSDIDSTLDTFNMKHIAMETT